MELFPKDRDAGLETIHTFGVVWVVFLVVFDKVYGYVERDSVFFPSVGDSPMYGTTSHIENGHRFSNDLSDGEIIDSPR